MGSHFLDRLFGGHGGRYGGGHGSGGGHHGSGHGYGPSGGGPTGPGQSAWGTERVLVCPNCRADNAADSRFCAQCGQRLGPAEQTCGKCGTTAASGAKFCPSCGGAVGAST